MSSPIFSAAPTTGEQQEIVAILDSIDRKIDLHKRKKAVLEELFRALLHKLMTGEIRVADLDLSALTSSDQGNGAGTAPHFALMRGEADRQNPVVPAKAGTHLAT